MFLNHRRPNVKHDFVKRAFVAHLYDALRSIGLNPFLDKKSWVKRDLGLKSIYDALEMVENHGALSPKDMPSQSIASMNWFS